MLDLYIWLEEVVDGTLTCDLDKSSGPIPLESPEETWVKGIGAVEMLTSAGMGVVDAFTSGKIFSEISATLFFGRGAPAENPELSRDRFPLPMVTMRTKAEKNT